MIFRKDINGLRAIAVLAVLLFHFKPTWLPGGFAGVDIFFVISGFLMTGIIFRGLEKKNFSILNFYVARANRIIPVLSLVCGILIVFGWFFLHPPAYKSLGAYVVSSLLFLSNKLYAIQSENYFNASLDENWLLHTWSLSIEWQFYIIYPLVLVGMRKCFSLAAIKHMILFAAILGFMYSIFISYVSIKPAYYLFSTRVWEMLFGAVAYLYPIKTEEKTKKTMELGGITLVLLSCFFVSEHTPWPGYLAIMPVFGAFLIIQSARHDSLITNNIVFQSLGSWSYSIYLWHWPIAVAIYYYSLNQVFVFFGVLLSILLGYLSYHSIEKIKFRRKFTHFFSYFKCKPLYIMLITCAAGLSIPLNSGIDSPLRKGASTPQAKFLNTYEELHSKLDDIYRTMCNPYMSYQKKGNMEIEPICLTEQTGSGVFIWGDSHAEALAPGLRTLLNPHKIPLYQITSSGCRPSLEKTKRHTGVHKQACDFSNKLAIEHIKKLKPRLVIISQMHQHERMPWEKLYEKLLSLGVENILVVGPPPQWLPSLPRVISKSRNWNNEDIYINDVGLDVSVFETDTKMKKIKFPESIEYLSLVDALCKLKDSKYFCRTKAETDMLLQADFSHFTEEGSEFVARTILAPAILTLFNN